MIGVVWRKGENHWTRTERYCGENQSGVGKAMIDIYTGSIVLRDKKTKRPCDEWPPIKSTSLEIEPTKHAKFNYPRGASLSVT